MFEWLKYKERLATVRSELIGIERDMKEVARSLEGAELEKGTDSVEGAVGRVAHAVGRIVGILIRIIDSLPG